MTASRSEPVGQWAGFSAQCMAGLGRQRKSPRRKSMTASVRQGVICWPSRIASIGPIKFSDHVHGYVQCTVVEHRGPSRGSVANAPHGGCTARTAVAQVPVRRSSRPGMGLRGTHGLHVIFEKFYVSPDTRPRDLHRRHFSPHEKKLKLPVQPVRFPECQAPQGRAAHGQGVR